MVIWLYVDLATSHHKTKYSTQTAPISQKKRMAIMRGCNGFDKKEATPTPHPRLS
ncbi:MAG: hypothetical protein ACI8RD_000781 [Bacillariaceae sp.]|jgi:hypothetical protein